MKIIIVEVFAFWLTVGWTGSYLLSKVKKCKKEASWICNKIIISFLLLFQSQLKDGLLAPHKMQTECQDWHRHLMTAAAALPFIYSFISLTGLPLFLLLSLAAGSAWTPRNWKWQRWRKKNKKEGMSPNSDYRYFSKRNYKAFNLPCCPPSMESVDSCTNFRERRSKLFAAVYNCGRRKTQTRRRPLMTALTAAGLIVQSSAGQK